MPITFAACVAVVVAVAVVRSTWSPCGWSMLSTITPLSERSRGHRFVPTGLWFVGGATLGGAALGSLGAIGSLGVAALDLTDTTRLALAAGAAALGTAFDAGLARPALPHHRRQVNEDWLDEFRAWVYAAGFGVQIGAGLATYIMTSAVYLVVVLGALSGHWAVAVTMGAAFGLLRGLAVLAGIGNTDPVRLGAFHRRFAALDTPVRVTTTVVLSSVAVALVATVAGAPAALTSTVPVAAAVVGTVVAVARSGQASSTVTRASAPLINATEPERRSSEPTTA